MQHDTGASHLGFATAQIHAGQRPDVHGARIQPIHLSAGFVFDDLETGRERFTGEGFSYTRIGNPTIDALERKVAALEGGAEAMAVGSGQAATTVALLGILQAGDHLISARSIYEGTRGLLRDNFARMGVTVDFVADANDPAAWAALVTPATRAFFAESIPNPKNDVLDIPAIAAAADAARVPLVVDNTLATPYLLRPLEHGAAIVVHSASKFLSGHGSALGGLVVDGGTFDWRRHADRFPHLAAPSPGLGGVSHIEQHGNAAYGAFTRYGVASRLGPTLSPLNAFLIQQGIETLSLRVARHGENAHAVASWLQQRPEVAEVDYAGLASHPQHDIARKLLPRGYGSVFTFEVRGGEAAAARFIAALRLVSPMSHLGDVRTLVLHPASTSHAALSVAQRSDVGIRDGHIRISVGIEDADDIIADLERGLAAAAEVGEAAPDVTGTERAA